jgi:hypothetical protein
MEISPDCGHAAARPMTEKRAISFILGGYTDDVKQEQEGHGKGYASARQAETVKSQAS